ncbi:MAG: ATP-binding protein [Candidatus Hatepunaea meridiana]|nr:ATP-binding protein [Candidatus Hatepunaea meridiana]
MTNPDSTLVGYIESVKGGVITIRLRENIPTLMMVDGYSYRVGQVGAFLRIPIGFTQLYAVCTLVGAAAAPDSDKNDSQVGNRWMTGTLFGESIGGIFERGISQYPTINDEVHLITHDDIKIIYSSMEEERSITIGNLAASSGIEGKIDLGKFVTRHSCIVGSSGAGKTNLVSVLLEAIATGGFPSARVLVIDPHGEYSSAVGKYSEVFKINSDKERKERELFVPYWALPFEEFKRITLGDMQPRSDTSIRERLIELKKKTTKLMKLGLPIEAISSDSPIPFSAKKLWYDLDDYERQTFEDRDGKQHCKPETIGSIKKLESNIYPAPVPSTNAPWKHPSPLNIAKQLELLKNRIKDDRYDFLLNPGKHLTPGEDGKTKKDLDYLVSSWVGHEKPLTILDVSGIPSEILSVIVGTMLTIIYDILFWASNHKEPLSIVEGNNHF